MTSTSISPRFEVNVRKTVESTASYEAEMGINAGILGPGHGFTAGIGSIKITESATVPPTGKDVAPKQI